MKRKVLPLVIAGLATGFATAASADVTVYGKANLTLNAVDTESNGKDQWDLVSNSSRFGIKGKYDISDSLKAVYKFEYEVYLDDGDDGKGDHSEFKQRNSYAGFQGNFGTLVAGVHDTPLKLAQGKVDKFNDLQEGDIKNVLTKGENRINNVIMYTTPKMGNFSATVAVQPGESSSDDGIADATSISLNYKADNLSLALANDSDVKGWDITRFAAELKTGPAKLGFLYQTGEESDGSDEQDGFVLSGEVKVAKNVKLKAQYANSETDIGAANDEDRTQLAMGVDYKLNKKAKVFAYYTQVELENDGGVSGADEEDQVFGVGYEIKF